MAHYRIIHVNAGLNGGAATGAQRVHRSLLRKGFESIFVTLADGPDGTYRKADGGPAGRRGFTRYLFAKLRYEFLRRWQVPSAEQVLQDRDEVFSSPVGLWRTWLPADLFAGPGRTVVNLHWLGDCFDYRCLLESIPADVPIVWTLRDMHPFTGGCHLALDCRGYASGCRDCPVVKDRYRDLPARNLALKRELLGSRRLCGVGISEWITGEAKTSSFFSSAASVECIPNGIDTKVFCPVPREAARECLGIGRDEKVICFGADHLWRKEKGFRFLVDALRMLANDGKRLRLLTFGEGEMPEVPFEVMRLGSIRGEPLQRIVYSAADVFAMPSIREAFGNTCGEAMACGVPVVGFRVGGIVDQVAEGSTGLLAESGDALGLSEVIHALLTNGELAERMGMESRTRIETCFNLGLLAERYAALYDRLVLGSE